MTHLSNDQIRSLLELAKVRDTRLYCMILLGWRHGLRASEIVGLRAQDFDMSGGGFLTASRLKGSNRTTQPLFADELSVLPGLLAGKAPTDFLFSGRKAGTHLTYWAFWDQFKALALYIGLPAHLCHPHVLKHTTGMTVIKKGIEFTRQYLGHKSIASTGAYLRVSDAEASQAARAAFGD